MKKKNTDRSENAVQKGKKNTDHLGATHNTLGKGNEFPEQARLEEMLRKRQNALLQQKELNV